MGECYVLDPLIYRTTKNDTLIEVALPIHELKLF